MLRQLLNLPLLVLHDPGQHGHDLHRIEALSVAGGEALRNFFGDESRACLLTVDVLEGHRPQLAHGCQRISEGQTLDILLARDAGAIAPFPAFETVRTTGEVDRVDRVDAEADATF